MIDAIERIIKNVPATILTLWGAITVLAPVAFVHAISNDGNIAIIAIGISIFGTNLTLLGIYLSYKRSKKQISQMEIQIKQKNNIDERTYLRKRTIGASINLGYHKSLNGIYKGGYIEMNSPYKYIVMWNIRLMSEEWDCHYRVYIYFRALSNSEVHQEALVYKKWWDYAIEISRSEIGHGELDQVCNLNRRKWIQFTEMRDYEYYCLLHALGEIEALDKKQISSCERAFSRFEENSITPLLNEKYMQNVKGLPSMNPGEQNVWFRNPIVVRWREIDIECIVLDKDYRLVRIYNPFAEILHTKTDANTGKRISDNRALQDFEIKLEGNVEFLEEIRSRLDDIFKGYNIDGSWDYERAMIKNTQ